MSLNFETFIDAIRMVDKWQEKLRERDDVDGVPSMEQVLGERILADFSHQYSFQGRRFDQILRPLSKRSDCDRSGIENDIDTLSADFHDLRRILFYSLVYATMLKSTVDAQDIEMKNVLQKGKLFEEYMYEQRRSLKQSLTDAISSHDHAVHERDKVAEELKKLSSKLMSSRSAEQQLIHEIEKLNDALSLARSEKDVLDEEVKRLRGLLSTTNQK